MGIKNTLKSFFSSKSVVEKAAEGVGAVSDPRIDTAIKNLIEFSIDYIAKPTGLVLAFYFLKNIIPSK